MRPEKQCSIKTDAEGNRSMKICPGCTDLSHAEKVRNEAELTVDEVRMKVCLVCYGKIIRGVDVPNKELLDVIIEERNRSINSITE